MSKGESKVSASLRKHVVIIVFWVFLIVISFQARALLSENVEQSTEFTDTSTESGIGSEVVKKRFNRTSEDTTHIIVIRLPESESLGKITDNNWRNFTLFLAGYLNETLFDRGYNESDAYLSEPIILSSGIPGLEDFASALVSDDEDVGLMWVTIESEGMDAMDEDVHLIRERLGNMTAYYAYLEAELTNPIFVFLNLTLNDFPAFADAQKVDLLLTGGPANFVDIIETAQQTFEDSEIIAV